MLETTRLTDETPTTSHVPVLLVTGPTGSGKSTTLYAALSDLARPEINVITVEDPVEYRLSEELRRILI